MSDEHEVIALLQQARTTRDADSVEAALTVAFQRGLTPSLVPLLCDLILDDWHTRHEDIALALEELRDPHSIDALARAALSSHAYLDYDENFGFARKCTWALARIATHEAFERLRELARCSNPTIAAYASKRLPNVA